MNLDEQGLPITTPYSRHHHHMHPLNAQHILQPTPRQYTSVPKFQHNYGTPASILQPYPDSSPTVKEERELNTYLYSVFPQEMDLHTHHPTTHTDHRYPSQSSYPSHLNPMHIRITSSRLDSPDTRLVPGPTEESSADFHYQIRTLQHQHALLPHPNHSLNHVQPTSAFFSPYSSLDQEHTSPAAGGLDRQPPSLEYDSTDPLPQHVSVPPIVYDPLPHESISVPAHSRHDTTLNHRGSLASINSNNSGSGSYHTANSPTSIPMSNNRGSASSSMNTSGPATHPSSSFNMAPSNSSRWTAHPSSFDMTCSTAGSTSVHNQIPAIPSTSTSASTSLSSLLHRSNSDSRSSPENAFTLRPSTSAQTLSSQSTHSHTNSPSPKLSDNDSTMSGRRFCGDLFSLDDRESDQDVGTSDTAVVRMPEKGSSVAMKEVTGAGEEAGEGSNFVAPLKKRKKSKMHCCEVCGKQFPRPSGLKTHMNTHNNEKPYPCGYPGCTRTFGVRSNAKRHLRTHGVNPTPTTQHNSPDAPYVVGFCPPMIAVPPSSSHQQSQLHVVEGGGGGGGEDLHHSNMRLLGDNGDNIDNQGQENDGMSRAPLLRLRWMPPSLTTRTNAGSLREVRDRQQQHGVVQMIGEEEADGEDEDDFVGGGGGSGRGRAGRGGGSGGYDMDMEQDDMMDDGDDVEFGENVSIGIPFRPMAIPSSSSSTSASASSSGIQLTMSRACTCSPRCSESGTTTTTCRSSSRTFQSSSSSVPSTTSLSSSSSRFQDNNNNRSSNPPPNHHHHHHHHSSVYGQREIEMTGGVGSEEGVYTSSAREYNVLESRGTVEERNSTYLVETPGSHHHHTGYGHHSSQQVIIL